MKRAPALDERGIPVHRESGFKRALSWMPAAILVLIIGGIVFAVFAFQNSWWTADRPVASADQQASDGMSTFTQAGLDFLTVQGYAKIKLRENALPATDLGLEADGAKEVELLRPVQVRLLGEDHAVVVDLIDRLTITTENDRVTSVSLYPSGTNRYPDAIALVRGLAPSVGWTESDILRLQSQLTDDARASESGQITAKLPVVTDSGLAVSASFFVDVKAGYTIFSIDVARPS